jgi:CspA family cold shock protein
MGRYKDYHREPRRGGFADDQGADGRPFVTRSGHESKRADATESVEAVVKWFNLEKGFGFVDVVGGSEAFMHIRQLEAAGHRSVSEGARVKVRIGPGQKGPEVIELIQVISTGGVVSSCTEARGASPSQVTGAVTESIGTVSLYKADKGFGFANQDSGGKDVFIHATALARAGLTKLVEGQRVRMKIGQGKKGLEAQAIELLSDDGPLVGHSDQ